MNNETIAWVITAIFGTANAVLWYKQLSYAKIKDKATDTDRTTTWRVETDSSIAELGHQLAVIQDDLEDIKKNQTQNIIHGEFLKDLKDMMSGINTTLINMGKIVAEHGAVLDMLKETYMQVVKNGKT